MDIPHVPLLHIEKSEYDSLAETGVLEFEHTTFHNLAFSPRVAVTNDNGYHAIFCDVINCEYIGRDFYHNSYAVYSLRLEVSS